MGNQLTSTAPTQLFSIDNYLNDFPDIEFEDLLGSSRFFKVAKAKHNEGLITIKIFVVQNSLISLKKYKDEIDKLKTKLENVPWCLPFHQTVIVENKAGYLIRQYTKYNLYDRLNTRPFLSIFEKKWITFQILSALEYLHTLGICHGDLKCENVLLTSWNWVLITDFAHFKPLCLPDDNPSDFSYFFDASRRRTCYLAPERFLSPSKLGNNNNSVSYLASISTIQSPDLDYANHLDCVINNGTKYYRQSSSDGRVISSKTSHQGRFNKIHKEITPSMDVFSAGCLLIEFFCDGTPPFHLSQLLSYRTGDFYPSRVLSKIPDASLRETLTKMINIDASLRPSAEDCRRQLTESAYFPKSFSFFADYFNAFNHYIGDVNVARLKKDFLTNDGKLLKDYNSLTPNAALTECEIILLTQYLLSTLDPPFLNNKDFCDIDLPEKHSSFCLGGLKFQQSYLDALDIMTHLLCDTPLLSDTNVDVNNQNDSDNKSKTDDSATIILLEESKSNENMDRTYLIYDRVIPNLLHLITATGSSDKVRIRALEAMAKILELLSTLNDRPESHVNGDLENANIFLDYILPKLSFAMSSNSNLGHDTIISLKMAMVKHISTFSQVASSLWDNFYLNDNSEFSNRDAHRGFRKSTESNNVSSKISWEIYNKLNSLLVDRFRDLLVHRLLEDQPPILPLPFSSLPSPAALVKRSLLIYSIPGLSTFFGHKGSREVLLSHSVTFLNDKAGPSLRAQFFSSLPSLFLGSASFHSKGGEIAPALVRQGTRDPEESVLIKAIEAANTLIRIRILEPKLAFHLIPDLLPFLLHPNLRVRRGVCGCIESLVKTCELVDVYVKLIPLLNPYLKRCSLKLESEELIFKNLKEPITRSLFNFVLQSRDKATLFASIERDVQLFYKIENEVNDSLLARMACILLSHLDATCYDAYYRWRMDYFGDKELSDENCRWRKIKAIDADQTISKLMAMGYRPEDGPKLLLLESSIVKISDYYCPSLITPKTHALRKNENVEASSNLVHLSHNKSVHKLNIDKKPGTNVKKEESVSPNCIRSINQTSDKAPIFNANIYVPLLKNASKINNEIKLTTINPNYETSFIKEPADPSAVCDICNASYKLANFDYSCNTKPTFYLKSPATPGPPTNGDWKSDVKNVTNYADNNCCWHACYSRGPVLRCHTLNSSDHCDNYDERLFVSSAQVTKNYENDLEETRDQNLYISNQPESLPLVEKSSSSAKYNQEWQQMFGSDELIRDAMDDVTDHDVTKRLLFPENLLEINKLSINKNSPEKLSSFDTNSNYLNTSHSNHDDDNAKEQNTIYFNDDYKTAFTANLNMNWEITNQEFYNDLDIHPSFEYNKHVDKTLIAIPSQCRIRLKKLLASRNASCDDILFGNKGIQSDPNFYNNLRKNQHPTTIPHNDSNSRLILTTLIEEAGRDLNEPSSLANKNTFRQQQIKLKRASQNVFPSDYTLGPVGWRPQGILVADISEHEGSPVNRLRTSPNKSVFASCSDRGDIRVWDLANINTDIVPLKSKFCKIFPNLQCKSLIWMDESILVAGYNKRTIKSFHLDHHRPGIGIKVLEWFEHVPNSEGDVIVDMAPISHKVLIALTHTNKLLGLDLRAPPFPIMYHDTSNLLHPSKIPLFSGCGTCMAVDSQSFFLVNGTSEGYHICWDTRFRIPVAVIQHPNASHIRRVYIHPSKPSKFYSCSNHDNEIAQWDVYSGIREKILWASPNPPLSTVSNWPHFTSDLILGPRAPNHRIGKASGEYIISAGSDSVIRYWDLSSPTTSYPVIHDRSLYSHNQSQYNLPIKYETRLIEGVAMIVETSTNPKALRSHANHRDIINCLTYIGDNSSNNLSGTWNSNLLISGSYDGFIKIWK
ncbi:unnamed protein product [Gordionus sp. m RMFG-2023]